MGIEPFVVAGVGLAFASYSRWVPNLFGSVGRMHEACMTMSWALYALVKFTGFAEASGERLCPFKAFVLRQVFVQPFSFHLGCH